MIQTIRNHRLLSIVLCSMAILYIFLPLKLQSIEPYNYAAAIERYYKDSTGFALAQGENLPDFGRYHPNHPLGQVLAGVMFDWFKIPALSWMKGMNLVSALCAAIFLYVLLIQLRCSKVVAAMSAALFLSTYGGMFTVFSGEWHMPALALSLAGIWQAVIYIEGGETRRLYYSAFLLATATCYHLAAFFFLFPIGVVLLFVRRFKDHWRVFLFAGGSIFILLLAVYVIIPVLLFKFKSVDDFFRTFFVYKLLPHLRYTGLSWIQVLGQTIAHTFAFTPKPWAANPLFLGFFYATILAAIWKFCQGKISRPVKFLILGILIWWLFCHWLLGARPDALMGWFFIMPFICFIVVKAFSELHKYTAHFVVALPLLLCCWNLWHGILPNSLQRRDDIFFFGMPPGAPKTTPIAFVVGIPLFSDAEIWYAGSELGYRKQTHFFPCCGENNFYSRLRRWVRENPNGAIVSDGGDRIIEELIRSTGRQYVRWISKQAAWPASLVPSTIYVQHMQSNVRNKRITVWVPSEHFQY